MMKLNPRTCVFTRKQYARDELYRFVKYQDKLVLDEKHQLPGRGYYISKNKDTIELMIAKKFLQKRFQVEDITDFLSQLNY